MHQEVQSKNASFGAYFYLAEIALNMSAANKTVWQGQCSPSPGFTLGVNAMDKPISLLMNKHITTVDINDTIDKVEKIMDSHKLTCALVIGSDQSCFGVISYPDIVHFHERGKNPKTERAWELCTHKVIEVSPDTSASETAKLMIKHKIHHIVITENKIIKGIVSSIDFVGST